MTSSDLPPSAGGSGGAAKGRASVGRASVSVPAPVSGSPAPTDEPVTRSVTARARVGRASVDAAPSGAAPVSAAPASGAPSGSTSGRASVGRASVGRATIAPAVAPSGPGGPDWPDSPPGGPGGSGPGRRDKSAKPEKSKKAKRRRRRNRLIALASVLLMLIGIGVLGGTYFFTSVILPEALPAPEKTTIYFADGVTQMASLGEENRTNVKIDKIPPDLQHAVVAAEDSTFYENNGIDVKGMVRALWNNVTGGDTQGASTITQQYVRNAFDLQDKDKVSYSRKAKEAAMAVKLDKNYSKDQILEFYLNTVYFGRGAHGVQAAAQAYFGKDVEKLSTEEGAVIAAVIKDPYNLDPAVNKAAATDRWTWLVKERMPALKVNNAPALDSAKAAPMKYPEVKAPPKNDSPNSGFDKPTGAVVRQVTSELALLDDPITDLSKGGYKITTTINKGFQDIAEQQANGANSASPMNGQPANLQAAMVAVEPKTGRVLAYYGGADGVGNDYAGIYYVPSSKEGEAGGWEGYGKHPPGSSFKVYDLATALDQGISVDSTWDGSSPKEFPNSHRVKGVAPGPVSNSSNDNSCKYCSLADATKKSLNTPYFAVTETVGKQNVLKTAAAAGVRFIWGQENKDGKMVDVRFDLTKDPLDKVAKYVGTEVGIGQYAITVVDQANGFATLAGRGVSARAHFVTKVTKSDGTQVYGEKITPKQVIRSEVVDDMTSVMKDIHAGAGPLKNDREAAAKTGTWQLGDSITDNAHAWIAGFTPKIAVAVWVGNKGKEEAIKYWQGAKGNPRNLSPVFGATLPGLMWKNFLEKASDTAKWSTKERFPPAKNIGDPTKGNATKPAATGSPGAPCIEIIPGSCPRGAQPGNPGQPGNGNPGNGGQGGGGAADDPGGGVPGGNDTVPADNAVPNQRPTRRQ